MTIISKKKNWNPWENCQIHALKLFWNACTWQELEGLIFYGQWINSHEPSQNGPRLVTNAWIDWFHIFITQVNTKQYCHVGNTAKQSRLVLFQDSDFAGDLEDAKSTSGGTLCVFGSHTFFPLRWMCIQQNQTPVLWMQDWGWMVFPHLIYGTWSSQFLETRLRTMIERGDPLWTQICSPSHTIHKRKQSRRGILPSNVQSSRQEALLYVFEDNEAVINMVIKGRSPTMRHVSEPTELLLIGCSIESTWTHKSKSSTSTPKTNLLTC